MSDYRVSAQNDKIVYRLTELARIVITAPPPEDNNDFTRGPIGLVYVTSASLTGPFTIKYMKKTNEKDGPTFWYVVVNNNAVFDVIKVCNLKKATTVKGKVCTTDIILSKYGGENYPQFETHFLSQKIN
ncbi:hypothetical protein FHW36_112134 [Chitinophaga polysaccharea]|uniref:Uncharacterized protein n=1 Tax=Chitinophaga polysaccharea TaxID=1293035 RepID=A0A561P6E7_9BACT|nr:hypothetical protein [Chitinophaga polysaccharea]TWF33693.1 hypothetical protein FHW36_112134 [Chitinophaga polysaccharea]